MHQHDCTFHGLHEWHKAMFEKLGWMIMAKEHKSDIKIESYLDSITRLEKCLEKKLTDTKDTDRQDDLKILLDNVKCLESCANRLMKISLVEHKHKTVNTMDHHKVTNCGLQHWMKMKYEHLGWMCLAQSHGNTLKVKAYFESIKSLISSLEQKIREVYEKDRRDDLEITLENTKLLKRAAWSLLMDKDGMKMSTGSSMTKKVSRSSSGSRKSNGSGSGSRSRSSSRSRKGSKSSKSSKSRHGHGHGHGHGHSDSHA